MSFGPLRTLAFLIGLVPSAGLAAAQYQTTSPESAAPVRSLKAALKEGRTLVGTTITVPNVDTALAMANAGFDFLWIEMEHGPITLESLREILLATRGAPAVPITRVPVNQTWLAKRVLDVGSLGVVFPFTSTRELAEQAVAACKYPPLGLRGFGPGMAVSRYGMSTADYVRFADENVLVVVIVETRQAVEAIESIASVPGIDVLFIGANDLSFSLGVGGRPGDPVVEQAVEKVLAAGRKYAVPVGYPTGNPEQIKRRMAQGFRFFQAGSELGWATSGAREMLSKIDRGAVAPAPGRP